jgi:hypothetical protein
MPQLSVPGQVAAGPIDGYLRDDAGDGTLGLPDYSLVPYTYAPMLGPVDSTPQWSIDQYRQARFAAFKGNPDGFGAFRNVGSASVGAVSLTVLPQASGTITASPDGSRDPDYTWGPRDFAIAVRHPGAEVWTASSRRAYLAFTQATNSVGMRLTTPSALGPWDAEKADSAALALSSPLPNLWDGNTHTFHVSTFGANVFCLVDGIVGLPFRTPRAYRRKPDGSTDTTVSGSFPLVGSGSYMGFDARGTETYLCRWDALQAASGDFFLYDMGPTVVQPPSTDTYTPAFLASGEAWALTGTVTASKDGVLLAANATASFNVTQPYGVLCTRWGTATAEGGLVFRRVDANNYYQVTSTGIYHCINGTLTKFHTFTTPLANGSHVAVRNWANQIRVYVNGVSQAFYVANYHGTGTGFGFRSPAAGTSQWRYIAFQPLVSDPVFPTV